MKLDWNVRTPTGIVWLVAEPQKAELATYSLATDVVPGVHDVRPESWLASDGVTDNGAGASADQGARELEAIATRIADALVQQVARLDSIAGGDHR